MAPESTASTLATVLTGLAWPAVAFTLAMLFRDPIRSLFERIESASFGGVTARLRERVTDGVERVAGAITGDRLPLDSQQQVLEQLSPAVRRLPLQTAREWVADLAREYVRVRAAMGGGPIRTRELEVTTAKMRVLAAAAAPLLVELSASNSEGERLAAVAVLQVAPNRALLPWLAKRLGTDNAFVEYHAGVALLAAARVAVPTEQEEVRLAVSAAMLAFRESYSSQARPIEETDRWRVLQEAARTLGMREGGTDAAARAA